MHPTKWKDYVTGICLAKVRREGDKRLHNGASSDGLVLWQFAFSKMTTVHLCLKLFFTM